MTSGGVKPFFFLTTSNADVPYRPMTDLDKLDYLDEQIHHIQRVLLDTGAAPEAIERATEKLSAERLALAATVDLAKKVVSRQDVTLAPDQLGALLVQLRRLTNETQDTWGCRLGVRGAQTMRYERHGYAALPWGRMVDLLRTLPAKVTIQLTWAPVDGP